MVLKEKGRGSLRLSVYGLLITLLTFPILAFAQSYGSGNYGGSEYGGTNNIPPTISITSPSNGASFIVGDSVTITASASDSDGSVTQVEFFVNDNTLGTTTSPYSKTWTAVGTGSIVITAVAEDNEGSHATTTVNISVSSNSSSSGSSSSSGGYSSNANSSTVTNQEYVSNETLRNLITQIQARIAELFVLIGSTSIPAGFVFESNLTVGSEHSDVQKLQQFLNTKGFTVSTTGFGSAGQETMYFGQLTRGALALFQSNNSIVPAVGFFGPITRSLVNSMLTQ